MMIPHSVNGAQRKLALRLCRDRAFSVNRRTAIFDSTLPKGRKHYSRRESDLADCECLRRGGKEFGVSVVVRVGENSQVEGDPSGGISCLRIQLRHALRTSLCSECKSYDITIENTEKYQLPVWFLINQSSFDDFILKFQWIHFRRHRNTSVSWPISKHYLSIPDLYRNMFVCNPQYTTGR